MRMILRAAAALALMVVIAQGWAETNAYQGPVFQDPALSALELTPTWRDALDATTAVIAGETVYYLSAGSLVGADIASGERLWRYGDSLTGPLAATAGLVLIGSESLTALDERTGEVVWRYEQADLTVRTITPLPEPSPERMPHDLGSGVVIAGNYDEGGAVLNGNGTLRYRIDVPGAGGPVLVQDGVLYWQASYGEPHFDSVRALNLNDGTELWIAGRTAGPLAVREGVAYLLDADWSRSAGRQPSWQEIVLVNASNGAELERWRYESPEASGYIPASAGRVTLQGEGVFVVRAGGGAVAEFPLGGATAPNRQFQPIYQRGIYRLGPLLEPRTAGQETGAKALLLFETEIHELRGVGIPPAAMDGGVGGAPLLDLDYAGPGAPISRLDVLGGTLYVGRTDGLLTSVDLHSARRNYFVRAGGFGFGQVLAAGSHVVLQTTSEIVVVDTQPPTAAPDETAGERVTLVTRYGQEKANADLVAVRDGDGAWRAVSGHAGNYAFQVESGDYSLAILCFEGREPVVSVYQFPASELSRVRHACLGSSELLKDGFHISGDVRGLDGPADKPWRGAASVAFGSSSWTRMLFPPEEASYSLTTTSSVGDLLALRTLIGEPPDRAILHRDLRIHGPTRIDLDFEGPDAVALEQHALQVEQAGHGATASAKMLTCNGTAAEMSQVTTVDPFAAAHEGKEPVAVLYSALPASERRDCDRFMLQALEFGSAAAGAFRSQTVFAAEPGTVQMTLPEFPEAPSVTLEAGATSALHAEWQLHPDADIFLLGALIGEVRWQVFRSAQLEPALSLPVLTDLPGWQAATLDKEPSEVYFGIISSNASASLALHGWQSAIGSGPPQDRVPGTHYVSVALVPLSMGEP